MVLTKDTTHHVSRLRRSAGITFARRSLDEVRTGIKSEDRGLADILGGRQSAGLQDNFHAGLAAALLDFRQFIAQILVILLQEIPQIHHRINLLGAFHDHHSRLRHLDFRESLRGRETTTHGGDAYAIRPQRLLDRLHENRVDANRRHVRHVRTSALVIVHALDHSPDRLPRIHRRKRG